MLHSGEPSQEQSGKIGMGWSVLYVLRHVYPVHQVMTAYDWLVLSLLFGICSQTLDRSQKERVISILYCMYNLMALMTGIIAFIEMIMNHFHLK